MIKSVFLRRIVLLILAAVLLSGILSGGIYILVTQRLYTDMRAKELIPIARTIADMMTDAPESSDAYPHGIWPLLDRENKNFLGASLHIYNELGQSVMNPPQNRPAEPDRAGEVSPPDLGEPQILGMIDSDLKTVLSGSEISVIRKSGDGRSYLVVGVPIVSGGKAVGAIIFTKAMSELNETLRGLNVTLVISTLTAFLFMLIPAYFGTKRLIVPIRQMRLVAAAMAEGDYTVRADETAKGEIGELGRSMNVFAAESARLEQTRRDYVANVSHELRTPIASIRAMGETLRDNMTKTDDKKVLFYNNIVRESMRLSRLVDDLLELSRLQAAESIQKKTFDLREVLQNVTDMYSHIAEESEVTLNIEQNPDSPVPVFSNPDRAEQLLVILLDNALKHTPEGGEISLTLQQTPDSVAVTVANTGETIPPEDLPHIFERFYKVDKSHSGGGTGLGLSIAKEIVKGLGEAIHAKSADGNTQFCFTLGRGA
ncbi:MAG: HAMP domain-containing histidine kinase [Oscillospiraceae bacterium]|jgi:signal transduction histidine kinase|nr:HAMP domain-containing histidine kinase [Oscillospiraceae bacterium]